VKIGALTLDGLAEGLVTDAAPRIAFALESDVPGEALASARISSGSWSVETDDQVGTRFGGTLEPFTEYAVTVEATGITGAAASATATFRTGRLDTPWTARWITDARLAPPAKKASPPPLVLRRSVATRPGIRRAWIEATALGIYELELNGRKVGDRYFAPGLTSYAHHLQYQTYDVTDLLTGDDELRAIVGGGWAVGSFTYHRTNRIAADRPALLAELHVEYDDGTVELIGTDESWRVATGGRFQAAEWYDGETFDATVDEEALDWAPASVTAPRKRPRLLADYGAPVRRQGELAPVSHVVAPSGEVVYDFGQNFAGVVRARLRGSRGQVVTFRHAEVLVDGELFVKSLRTAKATATYTCVDGEQEYSPRLTYMGFRYVGATGIDPGDLELTAYVLHSDLPEAGTFTSSNELLNRLDDAIRWGGKSNFVDIPTDCPQRDERQGWTGDTAVFASTAAYHFDMTRFFDKWLRDVSAEQSRGGGIPMVVPRAGDKWPVLPTACWGDACVLVPWAEYLARGDVELLRRQYPTMKRFLRAAKRWAGLFSIRPTRRLIWRFPFHFGDWAAPTGGAKEWIARGKWIATAYFANSAGLLARIAEILGEERDAAHYAALRERIIRAFRVVFSDGEGRLNDEFQTGYVLPLHFGMTSGEESAAMAGHLARLIADNGGHLATGFPGTPYLLFALSDHGRLDDAYELLLQTDCPSWLYMVAAGGTTVWERWDALRPDGTVNTADLQTGSDDGGGMVSFNHYAAGAVGDWMYRRIAGIEAVSGGYRTFRVAPKPGGGLTSASGSVRTPYGIVSSSWTLDGGRFALRVEVPVSTTATVELPDGTVHEVGSGVHDFSGAG
jgi:Alpha-L-rhamnosidase N-terminal domain./Bacterial alpha-L-rhamnosidase.